MKLSWSRVTPSAALVPVLGFAAVAALALILDEPLWCGQFSAWLGAEVFKLCLQFLLITVIGGGVFAYFAARREEQAKAEARIAELQKLDRELGVAYRSAKRVKRSMRAKLTRDGVAIGRIDREAFVEAMDEILDAQIATEQVREDIAVRHDLMGGPAVDNLAFALRYAARYLHDVYEDYERGRVQKREDDFVVDQASPNLRNFLLDDPLPADLEAQLKRARAEQTPLAIRFSELAAFEAARKARGDGARRQGAVAMECFRMASAQIRVKLADALKASPYRIGL